MVAGKQVGSKVVILQKAKAYFYYDSKQLEDSESLRRRVREGMRVGAREIRRLGCGHGTNWRG